MQLGKNEKTILLKLTPGQYTPPSQYMALDNCPTANQSLARLKQKGLIRFYTEGLTPEQWKKYHAELTPGPETVEVMAQAKLTEAGEKEQIKLKASK